MLRVLKSSIIKRIITGFLIGVAAITPGLSGGVIAATYGLYEGIIGALCDFKKDFKGSIKFLFPLGIGALLGVAIFSTILQGLLKNAEKELIFAFLGLIAGSIPSLIRVSNEQGFHKKYLIAFFISFALILGFEYMAGESISLQISRAFAYLLSGAILSVGTIIPGISSSIILMRLGIYDVALSAIADLNFTGCFLLAFGFVIAALFLIWIVRFLFSKYHGYSYYAVLGFLLASMIIIFPGFQKGVLLAVDIFVFTVCAIASYFLSRNN